MIRRFFSKRRATQKDIAARRYMFHTWFGLRVTALRRDDSGTILTFPPLATGRLIDYAVHKDNSIITLLTDNGEKADIVCGNNVWLFCDDLAEAAYR